MKTYSLSKLSLEDALEITHEMWSWLAENPTKKKKDWIQKFHPELEDMDSECSCCQFVSIVRNYNFGALACSEGNDSTFLCPLYSLWPKGCNHIDSPFYRWQISRLDDRAIHANTIATAALLKLNELRASKTKDFEKEPTKDPYAELKAAHKAGKTIQVNAAPIQKQPEWLTCHDPRWNNDADCYRIKPEPKLRPWKPEEVPVGALLRTRKRTQEFIIMGRDPHEFRDCKTDCYVEISAENKVRGGWQIFSTIDCEHSLDHGVSWKPCGVMEEQS